MLPVHELQLPGLGQAPCLWKSPGMQGWVDFPAFIVGVFLVFQGLNRGGAAGDQDQRWLVRRSWRNLPGNSSGARRDELGLS